MNEIEAKVGVLGRIVLLIVILSLTATASATQILVPYDQPTIQAAINASSSGDSVFVSPGTYVENINFLGKNILLKSTGGQTVTTILPADTLAAVISLVSGESRAAVIDGFHIIATLAHDGFFLENSSPVITNCCIENYRLGINATSSAPSVTFCRITGTSTVFNYAIRVMGAIPDDTMKIMIVGNSISNPSGDGIFLQGSGPAYVAENFVHDCITGISLTQCADGSAVTRNVACRNIDGAGIAVGQGGTADVSYNTCNANTIGIWISWQPGTNAIGFDNIIVHSIDVGLYDGAHHIHNSLLWNNTVNFANPPQLPNDYFEADPRFTSVADDDFSLLCESPATDRGLGAKLDGDGSLPDLGAIPTDHRLIAPSAMNLGILGENLLQVHSTNPTFAWSVDTATIVTTIADTVFCEVNALDPSDTIACEVNYTNVYSSSKQVAYEFQLGTDTDWSIAELLATGEVTGNDSSLAYTGPPLIQGVQYYARLRIKAESGWGCWRELVFRRNSAPSVPVLSYPLHDSRVNGNSVSLKVIPMNDLEEDAILCEFELFDDSLHTNSIFVTLVAQPPSGLVVTDTIAGLTNNHTFWWKARSFDGIDYSEWSAISKFSTASPSAIRVPEDFATIQTAINFAIDGDTIRLSPGTYEVERVSFLQKGLTLIGSAGADSTLIRSASSRECFVGFSSLASRSVISDVSFELLGRAFNPYNLTLKRCHFSQLSSAVQPIMMVDNLVSIDSCEFSYMRSAAIGGLPSQGAELSITNCIFHRDGTYSPSAIRLLGSASAPFHVTIANNHFAGQGNGQGIECGDATGHIENNELLNFARGMAISASSGLTIRNNIIAGCTEYAMRAPFLATDYNCYWNNALNYSETTPGAHDLIADPLFIDAANGDYHLQCASPCIDAGDPATGGCIGKHRDIGVFEYDYQIGNANLKDSRSQVSISDIVYLLNYIFAGGEAPCPIGAGKVDCNEFISVSDCIYLLNFLFAHGPAPCTGCP